VERDRGNGNVCGRFNKPPDAAVNFLWLQKRGRTLDERQDVRHRVNFPQRGKQHIARRGLIRGKMFITSDQVRASRHSVSSNLQIFRRDIAIAGQLRRLAGLDGSVEKRFPSYDPEILPRDAFASASGRNHRDNGPLTQFGRLTT
jgi:hypothetical protein